MEFCTNPFKLQSNPLNTGIEGGIDSVLINGVSVLNGLNLGEMRGLSFPRDKGKVSVIMKCPY